MARARGAPISPFALMVLTLTAALPSASNVSLLAERYGADNGRIARIIMDGLDCAMAPAETTSASAARKPGIPRGLILRTATAPGRD